MKKEEEAQKKGAQPVNEDELEAVTGGLLFSKEPQVPCRYCGQMFPKSEVAKHEENCPERPMTRRF